MKRSDAAMRILRAGGRPEELDKILQDECRRRAAKKLAATLSCQEFRFPTALSAEQCTSDALADFHAAMIDSGSNVLDLTCGLAIDAFHFAHKAAKVTCLDIDPAVAAAVGPNARALGLDNVESHCADCREWLAACRSSYDVIFIDPARRDENGGRIFSLRQCHPDVTALQDEAFRISPRLIIKASPMLDIAKVASELKGVEAIHAVGTCTECKELLIETRRDYSGPVTVYADTMGRQSVHYVIGESRSATYATELSAGDVLGEPWPAVSKVMSRGLLGDGQLHPSTMLWRNPDETAFPGNLYKVERIEPFSSSVLRRLAKEKPQASVAVRNFPLTADALRQRIKARESSTMRLMAITLYPSQQILAFLSPILEKNA